MTIVETKLKMLQRNILVCFSSLWDAFFALNKQKKKQIRKDVANTISRSVRMIPNYDIFHGKRSYQSHTK